VYDYRFLILLQNYSCERRGWWDLRTKIRGHPPPYSQRMFLRKSICNIWNISCLSAINSYFEVLPKAVWSLGSRCLHVLRSSVCSTATSWNAAVLTVSPVSAKILRIKELYHQRLCGLHRRSVSASRGVFSFSLWSWQSNSESTNPIKTYSLESWVMSQSITKPFQCQNQYHMPGKERRIFQVQVRLRVFRSVPHYRSFYQLVVQVANSNPRGESNQILILSVEPIEHWKWWAYRVSIAIGLYLTVDKSVYFTFKNQWTFHLSWTTLETRVCLQNNQWHARVKKRVQCKCR